MSTADQSTALQLDETRRLAEARGWTIMFTFEDVGVSGTRDRRPGLDRLMAAARRRRFDVLLVWRADRLFRSVPHMVAALGELSAVGIDFVSCTESFDTSTPTGKLLFHICTAFAQFERDIIVERTVAGIAAARRRGKRIGRPEKEVDTDAARDLIALGRSVRAAAKALGVSNSSLQRALARDPKVSPAEPSARA